MKAVKESKRLVALLAVLFLMSGVFSVIAAASPEDPAKTEPAQKIYTEDNLKVSEAIRIQSAIVKRALFEKQRDEAISARAQETVVPVEEVITEPEAVPAEQEYTEEYIPEEVYTEPEYVPEEEYYEPEYIPEEEYYEPEYVPEEEYYEPEYVPEEVYTEPEYVPEEVYYEPEEPVYSEPAPEPQPEPEYIPEAVPEATPEPVQEAVPESNLTFLGNFALSAYCPCTACCGPYASGHTASGTVATEGITVAMNGLDFGTKLMINGHIYTVEDRGTPYGLVDIFFSEHSSARAFGLQYADVYLVE